MRLVGMGARDSGVCLVPSWGGGERASEAGGGRRVSWRLAGPVWQSEGGCRSRGTDEECDRGSEVQRWRLG
jgi:hypothetical protein